MRDAYRIRPVHLSDVQALGVIERRCFSDPWSPEGFREVLSSSIGFGLIAEQNEAVLGYLFGRMVADEGEILNLAVVPEARRKGIGSALLRASLDYFTGRGVPQVFLEVRESNAAARSLYLAHGFRAVGQRASYYRNPPEDAVVLRLALEGLA